MSRRKRADLKKMAESIKAFFGERTTWVNVYDGYDGHIRMQVDECTFSDLERISEICGGTKNINFLHHYASGTEYTPSGDYSELVIFGPEGCS